MLDNLKIALKGLLVEIRTLTTILGEISEGNEAHVVGNWRKGDPMEQRRQGQMRVCENAWEAPKMLWNLPASHYL